MDTSTIVWIVSVIFGFVAGYFVARESHKRDPIHGGPLAHALHYVASGLMVSIVPDVLLQILIVRQAWQNTILMALTFFGSALLLLMVFAVIEHPKRRVAQAAEAEEGWTEQKARESGL
jgi:uncharacterized membrane protein YeaQ/YmgE (transglycosylase-associated protein family)